MHEEKLKKINRAFSPFALRLTLITQADGLGWYKGAPLALSFAGAIGTFPGRIAVQLGGRAHSCDCLGIEHGLRLR